MLQVGEVVYCSSYRIDNNLKHFRIPDISNLLQISGYIKEVAAQAMNDRANVTNTYLVSIGGAVLVSIALTMVQQDNLVVAYRDQFLIALCLITNAIGWFFFLIIVRLRAAWCDCARAMNHIKVIFVKNCGLPVLQAKDTFRWSIESIPRAEKKMTVFYFSAVLVSIPSTVAVMLAGIILLGINNIDKFWLFPIALSLYHLLFQMSMYIVLLEEYVASVNDETGR